MTVIWMINLQHQDPSPENIDRMVGLIEADFNSTHACRPRLIQLAANGPGAVAADELFKRGLPVELIGPADWRQMMDPLNDGPTEDGECCL